MKKGVVKDRKKLDAKYGRAAAECFAKIYAEELKREREAHAATVQEAAQDIALLASTHEYELRHERNKRDEAERALLNIAKNLKPRGDKGKRHKKTQRGWRTQREVAADFSKASKKIRGKTYGEMTIEKVKDWESRYPNEMKREPKSGYYAGLRNAANPTPEVKDAYCKAAANWNEYWRLHNEAFSKWLKANPKGDHALFLKAWERPGKTVHRSDTDKTKRYGADTSFTDSLDDGSMDGDED